MVKYLVYFLETTNQKKFVKIGRTKNLKARMKEIQIGCPYELRVLALIECRSELHAGEVERGIHRKFGAKRTSGEWFRLSVQEIASLREMREHRGYFVG